MADEPKKDDEELSPEEQERRMKQALKRALGTPPKHHKPKGKEGGA